MHVRWALIFPSYLRRNRPKGRTEWAPHSLGRIQISACYMAKWPYRVGATVAAANSDFCMLDGRMAVQSGRHSRFVEFRSLREIFVSKYGRMAAQCGRHTRLVESRFLREVFVSPLHPGLGPVAVQSGRRTCIAEYRFLARDICFPFWPRALLKRRCTLSVEYISFSARNSSLRNRHSAVGWLLGLLSTDPVGGASLPRPNLFPCFAPILFPP